MAILDLGGRVRSEQTKDEIIRLLKHEFANLSEVEREAVMLCLQEMDDPAFNEMAERGEVMPTRIYDALNDAEYIRKPVDIETFVRDPYYLGKTCDVLFPKLLIDMKELFTGSYREAVFSGCIDLDAVVIGGNGSLNTFREWIGRSGSVVAFSEQGPEVRTTGIAKHSGTRDVVQMTLANGMAQRLTPDHKVMVWRDGYEWIPAGRLEIGDMVVTPRRYDVVPDRSLSIAEAKLLAYWCADGSSSDQRSRFCDGNRQTAEDVLALLGELGYSGSIGNKGPNCFEVYVRDNKKSGFRDWLKSHEADRKTSDVIVPDAVCRSSDDVVRAFINRLWACEGCAYFSPDVSPPRFTLGMISERFIRQVQLLLLRFGVQSRIRLTDQFDKRTGKTTHTWFLQVSGVANLRNFINEFGLIYGKEAKSADILAYCERTSSNTNVDVVPINGRWLSMRMTELGIERPKGHPWWRLATRANGFISRALFDEWLADFGDTPLGQRLRSEFDQRFSFEQVTSVEDCKEPIEVGDICDVDGLHSFVSNGIYSHNSIGWGKSFFASICACRILYELSCMRDPHKSFGIGKGTDITMVVLSVKEDLAIKVAFENIANKIKESDYFKEHFPFRPLKKEILFPNKIQVAARASTDSAALGLNVFAAFIDESNFMQPMKKKGSVESRVGGTDRAQFLYDQLIRRMKSRFQRHGKLPGMMIVVSSKQTHDDFTAKRIKESKDDPTVFVRDYATWHVKPEGVFSKETFQVLVGNDLVPSKILTPEEVEVTRSKLQDGMLIIDVPVDYKNDFVSNLEDSIRDIAGVATVSVSPFIQQRDKIIPCIDPNRAHPFSTESWVQTDGGRIMWSHLARQVDEREGAEIQRVWKPLYHAGMPRHIHIDPSLVSDSTGFCAGCVTGYKTVMRRDPETQEQYTERAPEIWIDFLLRINPPVGGEIDQGLVRSLVYQMQQKGFFVSLVTMDQFNSASSLQTFASRGITAERLSVDKPMDAYEILKTAIYENRISFYGYEPLLEELKTIQKDNIRNKVDHPAGKSKDVADALAGVVFSLTTMYRGAPMGVYKGISQHADPVADEQREIVEEDAFSMPFLQG